MRRSGTVAGAGWKWLLLGGVLALAIVGFGVRVLMFPERATGVEPSPAPPPAVIPSPTAPTRPSGPLRVVGLGDSVESGFACGCSGFISTVAHRLGDLQDRPVVVHNEALAGATSADVLSQLQGPAVRSDVTTADLVVVEIGANDLPPTHAYDDRCLTADCYRDTVTATTRRIGSIIAGVKGLMRQQGARVVVMGYWNVFKDGDVGRRQGAAYVEISDRLTRRLNASLQALATRQHVVYADAYSPFHDGDDTGSLTADGDHPNATGHVLLARAVLEALGPLAKIL